MFAVACCRWIDVWGTDQRIRNSLRLAERFADDLATQEERSEARKLAQLVSGVRGQPRNELPKWERRLASAAYWTLARDAEEAIRQAPHLVVDALLEKRGGINNCDWEQIRGQERREEGQLMRHIVGNPFRPAPKLGRLPHQIRDLAEAVYQQDTGAVGPLHDALLEAGRGDLAEHFADPTEWHPKGCWLVDLLSRRK